MHIRPAAVDDVPHVLPLVRALCDLHEQQDPERFRVVPDVLDRYARWLPERAADPTSVFLVAIEAGSIVGHIVGTTEPEVPIFWLPRCGFIHDLYVPPPHRGRGVARGLVQAACERFASMGLKQVRLHTGAFNDEARRLFEGAGFRACVVEMLRPV